MVMLPISLFFIDRFFYDLLGGRVLFLVSSILMIAAYFFLNKLKITKEFLILAFLFFSAFLSSIIVSDNFSFHTSYITTYVRILYGAVIFSFLMSDEKSKSSILFLLGVICYLTLFESGVFFFKNIDPIININEILIYLLLILALFPLFKDNTGGKDMYLYLLFIGLIFLYSGSRQAILSLAFGVFLLLIYSLRRAPLKRIALNFIYVIVLFLPLAYLVVTSFDAGDMWVEKIAFINIFSEDFMSIKYAGDNKRIEAALFVYGSISFDYYLFGHGVGSSMVNYGKGMVLHNGYLTILYELGVLGIFAVMYMLIVSFRPFVYSFGHNGVKYEYVISSVLLPGIFIQSLFIEILPKPTLFIVFGVSLALLRRMRNF